MFKKISKNSSIFKNCSKENFFLTTKKNYSVPTSWPPKWSSTEIKNWINKEVPSFPKEDIEKLDKGKKLDQASEFLKLTQSDIHAMDVTWDDAKKLFYKIHTLRRSLVWPNSFPPKNWSAPNIKEWLEEDVALPSEQIQKLEAAGFLEKGEKFLNFSESDFEKLGIPWNEAQSLYFFCHNLKKSLTCTDNSNLLKFVESCPYPWPYNGKLNRYNTALVIIDMQKDFVGPSGYFAKMGYLKTLELVQQTTVRIQKLLATCRQKGIHVIHTREGHRDNLVCLPENKRWRSEKMHAGIGDKGDEGRTLTRGAPGNGWDIIDDLKPLPTEIVIDKPGKGTFVGTDFGFILQLRKIENLIFTGVTTDVCVQTTMREANDRGFECLLVEDGTCAAHEQMRLSSIESIRLSGGIFGATASTDNLVSTLNRLPNY